jgi:hypothetical protein
VVRLHLGIGLGVWASDDHEPIFVMALVVKG